MKKIYTVLGPIAPAQLGRTLMHEHVMCSDLLLRMAARNWWDRKEFMNRAKYDFQQLRDRGFNSIVDVTTIDMSRDIELLREVSETCEINIVAATGLYCFDHPWINSKTAQYLADVLIAEFEEGITMDGGNTSSGIKPGVIKCGSDGSISENNLKLLEATALAQKATSLPVITHSSPATAWKQMRILLNLGVPADKLIIGHTGDIADADLLEAMLKQGVCLGFDRFGLDVFLPDITRIETVLELHKRGWSDKIILSHDASVFLDWISTFQELEATDLKQSPYCHLADNVIPKLLSGGMTQENIDAMLIELPRKFLQMQ